MEYNVMITGVGGQGSVLASRIVANAAMSAGYEVRTSDTIGMAQRGGSVISHVRFGDHISSPLIANGNVDILLGFELAEAVRELEMLKPDGIAVVNEQVIVPPSVYAGISEYHDTEIKQFLETNASRLYLFNAVQMAREAGHWKSTNIVLLGALSQIEDFPLNSDQLLECIIHTVPVKMKALNERAFKMGIRYMEDLKNDYK